MPDALCYVPVRTRSAKSAEVGSCMVRAPVRLLSPSSESILMRKKQPKSCLRTINKPMLIHRRQSRRNTPLLSAEMVVKIHWGRDGSVTSRVVRPCVLSNYPKAAPGFPAFHDRWSMIDHPRPSSDNLTLKDHVGSW